MRDWRNENRKKGIVLNEIEVFRLGEWEYGFREYSLKIWIGEDDDEFNFR